MFIIPLLLTMGLDLSLPEFQPDIDISGNYVVGSYDVSSDEITVELMADNPVSGNDSAVTDSLSIVPAEVSISSVSDNNDVVSAIEKLNADIIGLSVGSIPSHLAWFRSIHDEINFNDWQHVNIDFPVIADLDLHVSKLYGMIHPNTSETKTVRAVFIIDNKSIIRTILYYPQTTGRNIKEILRILTALQTTDAFKVSTPADWLPGNPIISPAPQTTTDMNKRIKHPKKNSNVQTWYLTFRELPESKIYDKITKKKP